jgi:hypothetical protein
MGSMSPAPEVNPIREFLRRLIFSPAARYPADPRAVFMLAFSVFVGATALALEAAPATLNSLLPHWAVALWGIMLTLGSFITLAGMTRQSPNGIIVEQIGSAMVAVTTTYYAALATYVVGVDAIQSVGIVAAWGISCAIRYAQLQSLLNTGIHKAQGLEDGREIERAIQERVKEIRNDG